MHSPLRITLAVCIAFSGCSSSTRSDAKNEIRIGVSGSYASWIDKLVVIFKSRLGNIAFITKEIAGSVLSADLLENKQVDVTITGAHVAYSAFTKGTETMPMPHRHMRGMAVATVSAMHLVARAGSNISKLEDVKGKHVGVGPVGSSTEFTVRMLLPEFGIPLSEVDMQQIPFEQIPPRLADGSLDAEFVQVGASSPFAKDALAVKGTSLVPINGPVVSSLREKYPFFRPVVIPAHAYGQNVDTETIGVDFILVCHEDVSDDLVYSMLKIFFDSLPELAQQHPELGVITFHESPGVPIPLHPGAAAFFRERELFR